MTHETVYIREDGRKARIKVELSLPFLGPPYRSVYVDTKPKGAIKWRPVHDENDYAWRRLDTEERKQHIRAAQLEWVSAEEILGTKTEFWLKLKPTLDPL